MKHRIWNAHTRDFRYHLLMLSSRLFHLLTSLVCERIINIKINTRQFAAGYAFFINIICYNTHTSMTASALVRSDVYIHYIYLWYSWVVMPVFYVIYFALEVNAEEFMCVCAHTYAIKIIGIWPMQIAIDHIYTSHTVRHFNATNKIWF